MATLAKARFGAAREDRFFVFSALAMATVLVAGFSMQLAMGRSSFGAPFVVHAHALVFFGWVVLFVTQTALATSGSIALHRRLGWIGAGWMVAMVVLGCAVTVAVIQRGTAPFFFRPQHFLIANPLGILGFAGLTTAAIALRRRTDWHRRLHFCGMAMLMGPGLGRLLPMPFMIPWSFQTAMAMGLIFPTIGIVADARRSGRVHPAWLWGVGIFILTMIASELLAYSPVGDAIYAAVTQGTPGASVAPLDFAPPPPGLLRTGPPTSI